MPSEISLNKVETINEIIARLYDDEMDVHRRIFDFFDNIFNIIYFDRATIFFFYMGRDGKYRKHSSISINWEAEDSRIMQRYNEYLCMYDDTLPVLDRSNPIIFRSSEFFDEKIRKNEIYWKEYLEPLNCIYSLEGNLKLKNTKNIRGCFGLFRGKEKKDFNDEEMFLMKLFQPHLSNVLKHFGEKTGSTEIMFMLEKCNCVGVAILDDNCDIIRSSSTFDSLIDLYTDYDLLEKIKSYCMDFIKNNEKIKDASLRIKLPERPVFIEITKNMGGVREENKQFCCMLYDLSYFSMETLNQAKEDFYLTGREFDVLQDMLRGKSYEEIAAEHYISIPTVKKCVVSVYNKMEIHSQKQIFGKLNLF